MNRINHKLNEELLTMSIASKEERLKRALSDVFIERARSFIPEVTQLDYYMDAFIHSALGGIDAEASRHINIAKRYK
jgi:hypothetical protein